MLNASSSKTICAVATALLLAGCSGATYGTGVSQETQLINDLSSMVSVGNRKKERINYQSRPKLVKAPNTGTLPVPAEQVSSDDGYFPQGPERREARIRADADAFNETGIMTPELAQARAEAAQRSRAALRNDNDTRPIQTEAERRAIRKAVLQARAEQRAQIGAGPRRYLTQPPAEYRTPAPTAPVGQVGEAEGVPNKPKKQSLWARLTGAKRAAEQQ